MVNRCFGFGGLEFESGYPFDNNQFHMEIPQKNKQTNKQTTIPNQEFTPSWIMFGGIPDPLTVESEGLQGSFHKNEQTVNSLLVGGGYSQNIVNWDKHEIKNQIFEL